MAVKLKKEARMIISMIAALDHHRLIGCNNRLPWRLPADMQYFRRTTMGKPILMGRKTFESFGAKPLPGRNNIVLTQNPDYRSVDVTIVGDIQQALMIAQGADEMMVIGGAAIYQQMLPLAQRLYLTYVDGEFVGDTWFPEFDRDQWREVSREDHWPDEKNPYPYRFMMFEKSSSHYTQHGHKLGFPRPDLG